MAQPRPHVLYFIHPTVELEFVNYQSQLNKFFFVLKLLMLNCESKFQVLRIGEVFSRFLSFLEYLLYCFKIQTRLTADKVRAESLSAKEQFPISKVKHELLHLEPSFTVKTEKRV